MIAVVRMGCCTWLLYAMMAATSEPAKIASGMGVPFATGFPDEGLTAVQPGTKG